MGIETSGTGARTFDAARAAFAAAGAAWDPDSCTDPIARTVMSDQNPFALKVAAYRDANKTALAEHRNFGGSAVSQLSRALAYIASLPQLGAQQAEATAGEPGIDARPVPQLAIREALVNAIAHRDYATYTGSTIVNVTPAGVEVISLGGLYGSLKINDLINGANQPRNIALAGLLERLGFVHNLGNGIQQIMQAYDDGIDAPQLRVATASVAVILPLLRVAIPDVGDGARTDAEGNGNTGVNGNGGAPTATGRVATKYRFPGMPQGRFTHRIDRGEAIDQIELRRPAPDVLLSVRSLGLTAPASAARPITAPDLQPDSGRLNRSELEPIVLAFMIEKGLPLKRIEIQEPLNLSKSQASYALRGLTEAGKVRRIGHSRATRYLAVAAG